jgi:hypothetical protein
MSVSCRVAAVVGLALAASACFPRTPFRRHVVIFDKSLNVEGITTKEGWWDHECSERMQDIPFAYRVTRPDYTLLIVHSDEFYSDAQLSLIATSSAGVPLDITGHADMDLRETRAKQGTVIQGGEGADPPWAALRALSLKRPDHFVSLPAAKDIESPGTLILDISGDKIAGREELKFRNTWAHCQSWTSL